MLPTLKLAVDMLLAIFLMAFSVDRSRAVIHIYAASNKTMVLECPLNKTAETQIVWLKNNQTLKFNSRISLFEKHGLKISALNYDDDGEYTCVSGDNKTSEPKQLQVTSKPKIQIQEPFRKHVREGVNVIRKCRSHGIPRPTVEWFTNRHQRVNISDNSTSQTARMNVVETIDGNTTLVTLTISPVLYSDNGVFTCIASNRHSTVMESSRVDVRYSPKMTSLFNTTTRVVHWWETAVVNLTCTADGNPFPTITWSSEAEDGDSVLNCSNEERIAESTIARSNCWVVKLLYI
ncbi:neural cell adhesion molecule1 [Biomphalaria glabrata]|nr:neural cell adhesion molecule1 [Biomphalaria glabrata]